MPRPKGQRRTRDEMEATLAKIADIMAAGAWNHRRAMLLAKEEGVTLGRVYQWRAEVAKRWGKDIQGRTSETDMADWLHRVRYVQDRARSSVMQVDRQIAILVANGSPDPKGLAALEAAKARHERTLYHYLSLEARVLGLEKLQVQVSGGVDHRHYADLSTRLQRVERVDGDPREALREDADDLRVIVMAMTDADDEQNHGEE